jgi:hypothetical protein
MLSNLETEKSKLLQIVLVGQPNLREKLVAPELEQLRQRITVSYHLSPLDPDETANYINHRLRRAALGAPLEFPADVTALIHARSRGVPRIINVICDAALVFGYAEERRQINLALMQDVMVELEATGVLPSTDAAGQAPHGQARTYEPLVVAAVPVVTAETGAPVRATTGLAAAVQPATGTPMEAPAAFASPPSVPVVTRSAEPAAGFALARAEAVDGRVAALDRREQMVAQRERELAEQRRVLAEEYRLLRAHRPSSQPEPLTPSSTIRVAVPQPSAPTRFESARSDTTWGRFKRFVLGHAATAVEDT